MNVVFLDFDGVICTRNSYGNLISRQPWTVIDHALVANVQWLCEAINAKVVISSNWRLSDELSDLRKWLAEAGLKAEVIGITPSLPDPPPKKRFSEIIKPVPRGQEIKAWMNEHGVQPEQVIILEDEEDVSPFVHRQIHTTWEDGFTEEKLKEALELWKGK